MKATIYVGSDKDSMWEKGEELGLSGDALRMFRHAACEVRLELDVSDDGSAKIIAVDGRAVAD